MYTDVLLNNFTLSWDFLGWMPYQDAIIQHSLYKSILDYFVTHCHTVQRGKIEKLSCLF